MNIALINGSPKVKASASRAVLKDMSGLFKDGNTLKEFSLNKPQITDLEIAELYSFDLWLFAFPLYVDAIPSHLLSCLKQIEQFKGEKKEIGVYAVVNSGFYEGEQSRFALEILKNWCCKAGLNWAMGIGFGGGGALSSMENIPLGKGPKKSFGKALDVMKNSIYSKTASENVYISISFPKFLYTFCAEMGWGIEIKQNGGKKSDLQKQL